MLCPTHVSAYGLSDDESNEFNYKEDIILESGIQADPPVISSNGGGSDDTTNFQNYRIEYEGDGLVVVIYEEEIPTAEAATASTSVYKRGTWKYTHLAVTTGVLTGGINTAFYSGIEKRKVSSKQHNCLEDTKITI